MREACLIFVVMLPVTINIVYELINPASNAACYLINPAPIILPVTLLILLLILFVTW